RHTRSKRDWSSDVCSSDLEKFGFELHCDLSLPDNLEVNWKDCTGTSHQFHLTQLTSATCSLNPNFSPNPPPANFNTFVGAGAGRSEERRVGKERRSGCGQV